jgi:ABC-type branched-subunit amino acid transport system substrate-binding protein
MWAPLFFDATQRPAAKTLDQKVQAKFNTVGTSDHAQGYDCMNIVLGALKTAATTKPDAVIKALAATNYTGVLGRYVFNPKNHTVGYGPDGIPIPTAQIRGGNNVLIWPENVATSKYQAQPWMK